MIESVPVDIATVFEGYESDAEGEADGSIDDRWVDVAVLRSVRQG